MCLNHGVDYGRFKILLHKCGSSPELKMEKEQCNNLQTKRLTGNLK